MAKEELDKLKEYNKSTIDDMGIVMPSIETFDKKVKMDDIASYVNFGKIDRVFDFFSNIQCLINVDNDTLRKLSFFENGKYGFIFKRYDRV